MNQQKITEKGANMPKKEIDKETFKICEAVALGLDRYYMSDKHPTVISDAQREKARDIIKKMPPGWMQMHHRWDMHQ